MKEQLTSQQVIDFAAKLYNDCNYTRNQIWAFLRALLDSGAASFDISRVFDLIV